LLLFAITSLAACAESAQPNKETVPASTVVAQTSPAAVEAEVTELEHKWVAAILAKDTAVLEGILAEDFNGTSPTGSTFPRSDAIDDLKSGTYVVDTMALD